MCRACHLVCSSLTNPTRGCTLVHADGRYFNTRVRSDQIAALSGGKASSHPVVL